MVAECSSCCPGAADVGAARKVDGTSWCFCACPDQREIHAEYSYDLAGSPRLALLLWQSFRSSCSAP